MGEIKKSSLYLKKYYCIIEHMFEVKIYRGGAANMPEKELIVFTLDNLPAQTKTVYRVDSDFIYLGINNFIKGNDLVEIIGQIQNVYLKTPA